MEIKRLTIKNGEIGFYGDIYNKCSNKNDPKIRKQIESGKQYCDIKGYKYRQYSHKELSGIYKKLSLFEDIMEKYLIETPEMLDVRLSENSNVNKMFATKIADLEAKLAEMNEKYNACQEARKLEIEFNQQDKVELKQQLAESESEIKEWIAVRDDKIKVINRQTEKINQLKQQLAEKDAEVQNWKDGTMVVKLGKLEEQLAEKDSEIKELKKGVYKVTLGTTESNQIDFTENFYVIQNQTAIAVLEEMLDNEVYINSKLDFEDGNYVLSKIIRTKIEELKNGRN